MACPVLTRFRFGSATLVLLAAPVVVSAQAAQPATIHCTGDSSAKIPKSKREELKQLQQRVESDPLYRELVTKTGKAQACKATWEDDLMTLSYLFDKQGSLEVTINNAIESSVEKMKLPSMTEEGALALLKAAAKHSFGKDSCGIKWSEPDETTSPGSREVSYWGDSCNCQARKVYQGDRIAELIVSSAC